MNQTNVTFVVSRYNRDTSWVQNLTNIGYRVCVYEHGDPNAAYNIPTNIGKESSAYLKFIAGHYKYLTPYIFFIHDEDTAWHHSGHIIDLINNELRKSNSNKQKYPKFVNINSRCTASITGLNNFPTIRAWFDKYLGPYIGKHEKYLDWTYGHKCCAQMVVSRDRIKQHPQKMYADLYNWIMKTQTIEKSEENARYLEWTWKLIFDNPFKNRNMTTKQYKLDREQAEEKAQKNIKCRLI